MKPLLKNKPLVTVLALLVVILCGVIVAWQSSLYTLNRLSVKNVTTTQLAAAMRTDEFWSSYRFNTLLFSGTVKTVQTNRDTTTLTLKTQDTYGVTCTVRNPTAPFVIGIPYQFIAETYQAERQPNGVLFHNCVVTNS